MRIGAAELAQACTAVATGPADGRLAQDLVALQLLLDRLVAAAVAHDRARGDSWAAVASALGMHPEAARRRYRRARS